MSGRFTQFLQFIATVVIAICLYLRNSNEKIYITPFSEATDILTISKSVHDAHNNELEDLVKVTYYLLTPLKFVLNYENIQNLGYDMPPKVLQV